MSYKLTSTSQFDRQLKRLSKKYASIKIDVAALGELLKDDPTQGTALGQSCYKIRLNISAKKRGKRGGARVITHVRVVETTVYLLSIYDKSEQSTVSESAIDDFLQSLNDIA